MFQRTWCQFCRLRGRKCRSRWTCFSKYHNLVRACILIRRSHSHIGDQKAHCRRPASTGFVRKSSPYPKSSHRPFWDTQGWLSKMEKGWWRGPKIETGRCMDMAIFAMLHREFVDTILYFLSWNLATRLQKPSAGSPSLDPMLSLNPGTLLSQLTIL